MHADGAAMSKCESSILLKEKHYFEIRFVAGVINHRSVAPLLSRGTEGRVRISKIDFPPSSILHTVWRGSV